MTLPALPDEPMGTQDIITALQELRTGDLRTDRATGYHFESGHADLRDLAGRAAATAWGINGLDPTAFPSVAAVENDLIAAAIAVHGGGPQAVGTVTSGGTEACMLAVLGARQLWRRRTGRTDRPTLVLPVTGHPAFRKGAQLFDLDVVDVPVDTAGTSPTYTPSVADMVGHLDERAALVVVSAPSYPQGVIDPVPEVAAAAAARGIPCHLDMCIGGWVLPFVRAAEGAEPLGLDTPGVTSLSADLHKYGWAPKGVSVLVHADNALRMAHWFSDAGWPGYPVVNPTLLSSRSAGPAAAAWAILHRLGRSGLRELALESRRGTLLLAAGVDAIEGLVPAAAPQATLLAVRSDDPGVDVRVVADEMGVRGWPMQVQPARAGCPTTIHITVTPAITAQVDSFLGTLAESTMAARAAGRADPDPQLAAAAAVLDPQTLDESAVTGLLQIAGMAGGDGAFALPERMAPVNALLESSPPALVEWLLRGALGQVFQPPR